MLAQQALVYGRPSPARRVACKGRTGSRVSASSHIAPNAPHTPRKHLPSTANASSSQEPSLPTRLGALVLAGSLMLSAVPPPALADEEAAAPAISRFASPSEKRAAAVERRQALLRAAREEAERAGTAANPTTAPQDDAAAAGAEKSKQEDEMKAMLQRLSNTTSVSIARIVTHARIAAVASLALAAQRSHMVCSPSAIACRCSNTMR